jgi:hypothetical protein
MSRFVDAIEGNEDDVSWRGDSKLNSGVKCCGFLGPYLEQDVRTEGHKRTNKYTLYILVYTREVLEE